MKKLFIVAIIASLLALIVVGCGGGAAPASPTTVALSTTTAPATTNATTTEPTKVVSGTAPSWTKWHDPSAEKDELFKLMNGTGPWKLDHWTPGEEIVLVANENYWRKDSIWPDGPSGPPAIKRLVIKEVDEWGTRFASLQARDAENVTIDPQYYPQVDPLVKADCDYKTGTCTVTNAKGILNRYKGLPSTQATDILMNAQIATEGGNNYVGTGKLDGNGIPADFFQDLNVRKAFNYCFDYDTYLKDALQGEGIRRNGAVITPMLGYNEKGPRYDFDLTKCADAFKASALKSADGKSLWDTGFYMQITYNTGNITRKTVSEILKKAIESVNPKFKVEVYALPWPVMLKERTARRLPLYTIGWIEDFHDPHNWVYPYLDSQGSYGNGVPKALQPQLDDMIAKAASEQDSKKREQAYFDIQKFTYDNAIHIWLDQAVNRRYQQDWVKGWYYNPIYCDNTVTTAYSLSKDKAAKNPDQYTYMTFGDPESMDPAYSYETFGCSIIQAVYESPLFFKRENPTEFVPAIAEKYEVSSDGKTYTLTIRKGVKFHQGQELKASDVAYSIQRGLLQDRTDGPQNLLLQPILNVSSIAELAASQSGLKETPEKFEDLPADGLLKACQAVQSAVKADDAASTVTITLDHPFAAWPQILAQSWTSALSKEWVAAQGGWDGKCQ